jgi:redox-sensitive bicupin YhaK (pirin superfamily)
MGNKSAAKEKVMQIIRAEERFHLESDWLSAYWLFSFDRYYDPNNLSFGPLRVFNHDTVRGGAGFPTHPHREMEIVTYVLEGELTHKDSTGGRGLIRAGEVQRMTAGTRSFGTQQLGSAGEAPANVGAAGARGPRAFV